METSSRNQRKLGSKILFILIVIPFACFFLFGLGIYVLLNLPIMTIVIGCVALFETLVAAMALVDGKDSRTKSRGLKIAAFSFWFSLTIILSLFLRSWLTTPRQNIGHGQPCCDRLKHLAMIMNMYACEHEGAFPPIDNTRNNFLFEADVLYPEYLTGASETICGIESPPEQLNVARLVSNTHHPGFPVGTVHPDCFTDKSFIYLGWLITSDEEAEAFFAAYDSLSPDDFDEDIIVADGKGNAGGNTLHRLVCDLEQVQDRWGNVIYSGISGLAVGEALDDLELSSIPIMWDRPFLDRKKFNHRSPAGGNVLYLDGHLEYVRFGEKFPMTEKMARLLEERPRTLIPDCE